MVPMRPLNMEPSINAVENAATQRVLPLISSRYSKWNTGRRNGVLARRLHLRAVLGMHAFEPADAHHVLLRHFEQLAECRVDVDAAALGIGLIDAYAGNPGCDRLGWRSSQPVFPRGAATLPSMYLVSSLATSLTSTCWPSVFCSGMRQILQPSRRARIQGNPQPRGQGKPEPRPPVMS